MNEVIYVRREEWLPQLPALFGLAEFRERSGLSKDAAWQTCRYWTDSGRIRPFIRGMYLRKGWPLACPPVWHLAQCRAGEGYVTGMWALAWHGLVREYPPRLDLVVGDGQRRSIHHEGTTVVFHRLSLNRSRRGIITVADGGRSLQMAEPERALLDCLACPSLGGGLAQPAELLRSGKKRFRQFRLLDILLDLDSETLRRRLRVLAEYAGMLRLTSWLEQQRSAAGDRMGPVVLDPSRSSSPRDPLYRGVRINLPLLLPGLEGDH